MSVGVVGAWYRLTTVSFTLGLWWCWQLVPRQWGGLPGGLRPVRSGDRLFLGML